LKSHKNISTDLKYFIYGSFYTGLSSVSGLLVPLLVVPFLLIKVGLENYGISAVAFSISFFFSMIVDYGFIITGVNKLSKIENDSKVSCIINNIIYTKIFIFLLMLPLFLVGYYFTITKNLEWDVFLFSLCIPLSSIVNLSWALRGLHQIKAWSILTIVGQIFYISLIFVFINEPSDVYKINLFYGFGVLLTGFLSIVFLKKKYHLKFNKVNLRSIFLELKDGYHFFLSNIGNYVSLYFLSPLIGFLLSYEMAGIYSIIEKIYNLARKPFSIYQTFMLPKISQQVQIDKEIAKRTIKNTYVFVTIFILLEVVLIFLFRDDVILYFTLTNLSLLKSMLILSLIGIIIVIINCPIFLYLTALNRKKILMRISLIAPVIGIIFGFIFINIFGIIGSIFTIIFIELYFTISLFLVYKKEKIII
jgi:O-antigen/teichoic acid export membrane protein